MAVAYNIANTWGTFTCVVGAILIREAFGAALIKVLPYLVYQYPHA